MTQSQPESNNGLLRWGFIFIVLALACWLGGLGSLSREMVWFAKWCFIIGGVVALLALINAKPPPPPPTQLT